MSIKMFDFIDILISMENRLVINMEDEIYKNMKRGEASLSIYACKDKEAIRFNKIEDDIRPPFFRDSDKILYSLSYFRYLDKTQVFSFESNDMISTRMTHIQLVSKIARTIGRGLKLNEDLIEAASLGHDLGHAPFGHTGEKILNDLSLKYGEGYFNHNVQSVRILMNIENNGKGSNITLQVLDAILCHNGEEIKQKYIPMKKESAEFINEYNSCYKSNDALAGITAMTLEGCVVRISDVIAYAGKDVEDAIRLKKITKDQLPESVIKTLGITNSEIVNTIVMDVLENSINKNYIAMSNNVYNALIDLINFNYKKIYTKSITPSQLNQIKLMFNKLFNLYYNQIINNEIQSDIFDCFLNQMSSEYLSSTSSTRKVLDFMSGMTDSYFLRQYKKYF